MKKILIFILSIFFLFFSNLSYSENVCKDENIENSYNFSWFPNWKDYIYTVKENLMDTLFKNWIKIGTYRNFGSNYWTKRNFAFSPDSKSFAYYAYITPDDYKNGRRVIIKDWKVIDYRKSGTDSLFFWYTSEWKFYFHLENGKMVGWLAIHTWFVYSEYFQKIYPEWWNIVTDLQKNNTDWDDYWVEIYKTTNWEQLFHLVNWLTVLKWWKQLPNFMNPYKWITLSPDWKTIYSIVISADDWKTYLYANDKEIDSWIYSLDSESGSWIYFSDTTISWDNSSLLYTKNNEKQHWIIKDWKQMWPFEKIRDYWISYNWKDYYFKVKSEWKEVAYRNWVFIEWLKRISYSPKWNWVIQISEKNWKQYVNVNWNDNPEMYDEISQIDWSDDWLNYAYSFKNNWKWWIVKNWKIILEWKEDTLIKSFSKSWWKLSYDFYADNWREYFWIDEQIFTNHLNQSFSEFSPDWNSYVYRWSEDPKKEKSEVLWMHLCNLPDNDSETNTGSISPTTIKSSSLSENQTNSVKKLSETINLMTTDKKAQIRSKLVILLSNLETWTVKYDAYKLLQDLIK